MEGVRGHAVLIIIFKLGSVMCCIILQYQGRNDVSYSSRISTRQLSNNFGAYKHKMFCTVLFFTIYKMVLLLYHRHSAVKKYYLRTVLVPVRKDPCS